MSMPEGKASSKMTSGDVVCISEWDGSEIYYLNQEGEKIEERFRLTEMVSAPYQKNTKNETTSASEHYEFEIYSESLGIPIAVQEMAITLDGKKYRLTIARDISLQQYDDLTGTFNRKKYVQKIAEIKVSNEKNFGILIVDIDNLRRINRDFGRLWGDSMLKYTANVLQNAFSDPVYRTGEDEFLVFAQSITKEEFREQEQRLLEQTVEDEQFQVSIGATWHSGQVDIEEQILNTGDRLRVNKLNAHKKNPGSGNKFRGKLTEKLLKDIADDRFLVYLQPQIDLQTEKIGGAEALVRYRTKEGKIVPPIDFVGKYESEGIINYMDLHMLEKVCKLLHKWQSQGLNPGNVSVNFSRVTMMVSGIVKQVCEICNKYRIDPSLITIEVTESIGLLERQELRALLENLQREGFRISLDDFGSRYSDLAILSIGNFNEIKLDKSLVDQIESKSKARTIAAYVLQMCMGLETSHTVAEGIENISQKAILKRFGCKLGQGYLFDRPLPVAEFEQKYLLSAKEETHECRE
ncbi:diguanylate cyclase (GGDEF)-like protein [Ohessyouella blattaphilus]